MTLKPWRKHANSLRIFAAHFKRQLRFPAGIYLQECSRLAGELQGSIQLQPGMSDLGTLSLSLWICFHSFCRFDDGSMQSDWWVFNSPPSPDEWLICTTPWKTVRLQKYVLYFQLYLQQNWKSRAQKKASDYIHLLATTWKIWEWAGHTSKWVSSC